MQQIALGSADKARLAKLWVDLLGLERTGSYRSESENVDEDILRIGAGALGVEIDLMQPIDPQASPRVAEPALNHVGLWVDDLPSAVDVALRARRSLRTGRDPPRRGRPRRVLHSSEGL